LGSSGDAGDVWGELEMFGVSWRCSGRMEMLELNRDTEFRWRWWMDGDVGVGWRFWGWTDTWWG